MSNRSHDRNNNVDKRLRPYRAKRHFNQTKEPYGKKAAGRGRKSSAPIFVIQQHQASSHHFDVRLEIDGALVSWAVPKGPSTDPSDKRLAIHVEDHPLDYADFEGVIPEGEYGGGVVQVWDMGPYINIAEDKENVEERRSMGEALEEGRIEVAFAGQKIRGGYVFVHTKGKHWLMIKMKDRDADARRNPVKTEGTSVISGRSLAEIAAEEEADD